MLSLYLTYLETQEEKSKLEKLYYKYKALMKYVALNILEDDGIADDAVHEAFMKLTRYLDGLDEIESHKTKAFIVIVIRSVALDMLSKEKRHRIYCLEDIEDIADFSNDIFENLEIENIYTALNSLPDTYRDIIQLKVYYNLSDKQISDILCISSSAVRKRLQRARSALKKSLKERGVTDVCLE